MFSVKKALLASFGQKARNPLCEVRLMQGIGPQMGATASLEQEH